MRGCMGVKNWILVFAAGDVRNSLCGKVTLDRRATDEFAGALFPAESLASLGDTDLLQANPPDDEMIGGCFDGVSIVAAREFGIDFPSKLDARFVAYGKHRTIYLHSQHSVVDWFAFAVWQDGKLVRALSLSPDRGVMENIGEPLPFEEPFWDGQHAEGDDYPLPFHPLELAESARRALFGYRTEGIVDPELPFAEDIPMTRFKRAQKSWWKFWS